MRGYYGPIKYLRSPSNIYEVDDGPIMVPLCHQISTIARINKCWANQTYKQLMNVLYKLGQVLTCLSLEHVTWHLFLV